MFYKVSGDCKLKCVMSLVFVLALLSGCSSPSSNSSAVTSQQKNGSNDQAYSDILLHARSYLEQGQYRASILEAKKALRFSPGALEASMLLAENHLEMGNASAALQAVRDLKEVGSEEAIDYQLLKSRIFLEQEKFQSAIDAARSIDLSSATKEQVYRTQLSLARAYTGSEQFDVAKNILLDMKNAGFEGADLVLARASLDFRRGEHALALLTVKEGLASYPGNPDLLRWAGNLAKLTGQLEDAAQYYTQALSNIPNTDVITKRKYQILTKLTDTFTQLGYENQSLIYSKILAEEFPGYAEIKSDYDQAIEALNNASLEEAEKMLKALYVATNEENNIGALLGLLNYKQGNYSEAQRLLSENLDLELASSSDLHLLLETNLRIGDRAKLLEVLDSKFLEKHQDNAALQQVIGLSALALGRVEVGVDALRKAIALEPENPVHVANLSRYYVNTKQYELAKPLLLEALNQADAHPTVGAGLLDLYLITGHFKAADALTKELKDRYPNEPVLDSVYAKQLILKEDYFEARKVLVALLDDEAMHDSALRGLAELSIKEKRWSDAENYYRQLVRELPSEAIGYKGLLSVYRDQQKVSQGVEQLTQLAEQPEHAFTAHKVLAEYLSRTQNFERALAHAQVAGVLNPSSLVIKMLQTDIYLELVNEAVAAGEIEDARQLLLEAKRAGLQHLKLSVLAASIDIKEGKLVAAESSIRSIGAEFPEHPSVDAVKGDFHAKKGEFIAALDAYKAAWRKSPNNRLAESITLLTMHKHGADKALDFINEWQALDKNNATAWYFGGFLLQSQQKNDMAIEYYQEAITLEPAHANAMNNLAWIYFEKNHPKALEIASQAYKLSPEDAGILDTYGWILVNQLNQEQRRLGITLLEKAVKKAPENALIKSHLEKARQS